MAKPRIVLNSAGVRALLNDPGVTADLTRRMAPVLATAQATAPVGETGGYVASLRLWVDQHPTRTVVHVGSDTAYALQVEGAHGTLSRALDQAGGA